MIDEHEIGERPQAAFLLSAKDPLTAEAYEEMLKRNGVEAVIEKLEPTGPFAAVSEIKGSIGAPINIYVSSRQLDYARRLVDDYDNEPVVFNTPPPALNRKSRVNQFIFALVIIMIFVIPLGVAFLVIASRVVRFFIK